jgi:hypothetical protein
MMLVHKLPFNFLRSSWLRRAWIQRVDHRKTHKPFDPIYKVHLIFFVYRKGYFSFLRHRFLVFVCELRAPTQIILIVVDVPPYFHQLEYQQAFVSVKIFCESFELCGWIIRLYALPLHQVKTATEHTPFNIRGEELPETFPIQII